MTRRRRRALVLAFWFPSLLIAACPAVSAGPAPEIHGADAVFTGSGVVIAWGVLRGPDEAATSVVVRVASHDTAIRAVAVDLVDPFGGKRIEVLRPSPLDGSRVIRIPRARFAEHPRAELRFAAGTDALISGSAAFTVYFTGVPDTTPEFQGEGALAAYLESALARAAGR